MTDEEALEARLTATEDDMVVTPPNRFVWSPGDVVIVHPEEKPDD